MQNKYVSMRKIKLNRAHRQDLEQIYSERIHSPSTIVFDFKQGEYPLFVMVTPQMLDLFIKIQRDSALLVNLQDYALPNIARTWYLTKILVDEIKLTNDMENVHSTRKEVKEAVESVENQAHPQDVRFYGMALKYFSLGRQTADVLKTCGDVRKLYDDFVNREVVTENASDAVDGQLFRTGQVYVQDSHGRIIHEGSYPESTIIDHMEKALAILNDESVNRLIRIAVFHYLFGFIHPFYNGNGRLSRYISSMALSDELSTLVGLRLSYVIKDHKRQYDNLFKEANDRRNMGDLTDFVETFCSYVSIALRDMIDTLQMGEDFVQLIDEIIDSSEQLRRYKRLFQVLGWNGLFAEDSLSISDLQKHTELGRSTVEKALGIANDMDLLTVTKSGHKKLYTIKPEAWSDLQQKIQRR